MKYRLDKEEIYICKELSRLGLGSHTLYFNEYFEEFGDMANFIGNTLPQLVAYNFITTKNFTISKKQNAYIEDIFLKKIHKLIVEDKIDLALRYAKEFQVDQITLLLGNKINLENFGEILRGNPFYIGGGGHFDYDMITLIALNIDVNQALIDAANSFIDDDPIPQIEDFTYEKNVSFDEMKCEVRYHGLVCEIGKFSKQRDLLRIVFEEPDKDWQFSEIAEKIDPADDYNWKRLYNTAQAINTKIAVDLSIKDFFDTTTQSVKINPKYLKNDTQPTFDEF